MGRSDVYPLNVEEEENENHKNKLLPTDKRVLLAGVYFSSEGENLLLAHFENFSSF